jgi:hypothetical protein
MNTSSKSQDDWGKIGIWGVLKNACMGIGIGRGIGTKQPGVTGDGIDGVSEASLEVFEGSLIVSKGSVMMVSEGSILCMSLEGSIVRVSEGLVVMIFEGSTVDPKDPAI